MQFLHQVDIFSLFEDLLGLSHVEGAAHPFVRGIGGENGRTWELAAFPFTLLQQRPLAFVKGSVVLHVKARILVVLIGASHLVLENNFFKDYFEWSEPTMSEANLIFFFFLLINIQSGKFS